VTWTPSNIRGIRELRSRERSDNRASAFNGSIDLSGGTRHPRSPAAQLERDPDAPLMNIEADGAPITVARIREEIAARPLRELTASGSARP
jgi:hypothetical protein